MGEPCKVLPMLWSGKISPKPCRHTWLVCLSECCLGDDNLVRVFGTQYIGFQSFALWHFAQCLSSVCDYQRSIVTYAHRDRGSSLSYIHFWCKWAYFFIMGLVEQLIWVAHCLGDDNLVGEFATQYISSQSFALWHIFLLPQLCMWLSREYV